MENQHRSKWNMVMNELKSPKVCEGRCQRKIYGLSIRIGPKQYVCQKCKLCCYWCDNLLTCYRKSSYVAIDFPGEDDGDVFWTTVYSRVCDKCHHKCFECGGDLCSEMMFTERGEKYCKACARECERCHITSSARGHDETTCTRPSLVYKDIPGDIVARRSNYFVPINKIVRQYIKEQAKDEKRKRIKEDQKKKNPKITNYFKQARRSRGTTLTHVT